jgi:hypothetical protein
MRDLISKVTFGFAMAQLLPGAIVFSTIVFTLNRDDGIKGQGLYNQLKSMLEPWSSSAFGVVVFLIISTGIGMLIHGLNWTVLAWLENRNGGEAKPVRETKWHKWSFWKQLLSGPLIMICELLYLLFKAPNIESLTMDENVSDIKEKQMKQFQFLQDFYLHFGQFYAHTSYALLVVLVCGIICCVQNPTKLNLYIAFGLYFLTSFFFLLGRIQLSSLFKAETSLRGSKASYGQDE